MKYNPNILQHFKDSIIRDKEYIKPFMLQWDYQDKGNSPMDFSSYGGVDDLVKWLEWQNKVKQPYYIDMIKYNANHSRETNDMLFGNIIKNDFPNVDINNALDWAYTHLYPIPERQRINKVLDFGCGFGRNFNMFRTFDVFIAMDAIPLSYCLQHLYLSMFDEDVREYVTGDKIDFTTHCHLPTWRMDLIPDNSLDMVMCIQVLPELNREMIYWLLDQVHNKLKPEGAIYIRDHGKDWQPVHKLNIDGILNKFGFHLEFAPLLKDKVDIHGLPRIWRKL